MYAKFKRDEVRLVHFLPEITASELPQRPEGGISCAFSTMSIPVPASWKYEALSYACYQPVSHDAKKSNPDTPMRPDQEFMSSRGVLERKKQHNGGRRRKIGVVRYDDIHAMETAANCLDHLDIEPNLWYALLSLRLKETVRVLFVDALCINQTDEDERTDQVLKMSTVFSLATRVLIWLGPGSFTYPPSMAKLAYVHITRVNSLPQHLGDITIWLTQSHNGTCQCGRMVVMARSTYLRRQMKDPPMPFSMPHQYLASVVPA